VVRSLEPLNVLDKAQARGCGKVAAVKKRHEADAAGFQSVTAKSAALESVLSVIARLATKVEEEGKEARSEDRVSMYKTVLEHQYDNFQSQL
jgi:hypothetical protein